jgi:hypothetical protein
MGKPILCIVLGFLGILGSTNLGTASVADVLTRLVCFGLFFGGIVWLIVSMIRRTKVKK